jgi:hypothetical protein
LRQRRAIPAKELLLLGQRHQRRRVGDRARWPQDGAGGAQHHVDLDGHRSAPVVGHMHQRFGLVVPRADVGEHHRQHVGRDDAHHAQQRQAAAGLGFNDRRPIRPSLHGAPFGPLPREISVRLTEVNRPGTQMRGQGSHHPQSDGG